MRKLNDCYSWRMALEALAIVSVATMAHAQGAINNLRDEQYIAELSKGLDDSPGRTSRQASPPACVQCESFFRTWGRS